MTGQFRPPFTTPGHVLRSWFKAAKRPKTIVSGMAYQGFETQADGFCIRCRTASHPCLLEEFVVQVKGLLHTYNCAI